MVVVIFVVISPLDVLLNQLSVQEGLVKSASEDKTKAEEVIATLRRDIAERERVLKSLMVSLCDLAEQVSLVQEVVVNMCAAGL